MKKICFSIRREVPPRKRVMGDLSTGEVAKRSNGVVANRFSHQGATTMPPPERPGNRKLSGDRLVVDAGVKTSGLSS